MGQRISRIQVEALHDQFDVDLDFSPGLNIIYGKNGRGKTTVLHILANALELDFSRFDHLSFASIYIDSFEGDQLQIKKVGGETLVSFNGDPVSNEGLVLGDISGGIRNAFGDTPTYLPAFRSVLERMRDPAYQTGADASLEALNRKELETLTAAMKSSEPARAMHIRSNYALREEAAMTARKTLQCRQWFGSFVPVIRYPSIAEVSEGLTTEWRNAQLDIAQKEQSMFAQVFVRVFRAIVGMETGPKKNQLLSTAEMLSVISGTLTSDDEKQNDHDDYQLGNYKGDAIYRQLKEAMEYMDRHPQSETREIETSVLNLYLETLTHRKQERKNALQKSRDFETSINKFLDSKKLRIGDFGEARRGPASAISVKSTAGGHAYTAAALSSGEKQVLTMLYSASRSRFKSGAFLIDEPELSLHVDWQRIILRELIAQSPDRQIIVCTHSPEVGADHLLETQEFNPTPTRSGQSFLFPPIDEEGE